MRNKNKMGRTLKSWKHLLFVLALALFYAHPASAGKVFNAESFTLDNGMSVVVIPNHRAPVVTQMVWYKVGAADEPQGLSGIAHFLEHLMFKGSPVLGGKVLNPGEFSEIIRALGGNDNAFTSQDYTAYYESVAVENLETVMRMEAGRMRGMSPPPDHVLSERQVIREERRQRTENDPGALFNEELAVSLYPDHPYGIPVIGWAEEMEALSWEDTEKFYDAWYAPNNAILVISGDVTAEQVRELAQRIYGAVPAHDPPERNRTSRPPKRDLVFPIRYEHPAIRQPMIEKAYKVPSFLGSKQESLALEVLQEIAGAGSSSRLYKSLVIEQKIASEAGMSYSPENINDTALWVYASPLPGVKLETLEKALDKELKKLIKKGVSAQELSDAKSRLQNASIYARDSLSGPAMVVGRALVTGQTLDDVESWPDAIETVTTEQIQAVAAKYLDPSKNGPVTGYLLPKAPEQEVAK